MKTKKYANELSEEVVRKVASFCFVSSAYFSVWLGVVHKIISQNSKPYLNILEHINSFGVSIAYCFSFAQVVHGVT